MSKIIKLLNCSSVKLLKKEGGPGFTRGQQAWQQRMDMWVSPVERTSICRITILQMKQTLFGHKVFLGWVCLQGLSALWELHRAMCNSESPRFWRLHPSTSNLVRRKVRTVALRKRVYMWFWILSCLGFFNWHLKSQMAWGTFDHTGRLFWTQWSNRRKHSYC